MLAEEFLASELVVPLLADPVGRRLRTWSTTAHRALEDEVLARVDQLTDAVGPPATPDGVSAALDRAPHLGEDQVDAVEALCGPGTGLRCVLSPAGYGKTAMLATAAEAVAASGGQVLGLATTAQAVGELRTAGLDACTIAAFATGPVPDGVSVLLLDEVSQTSTRDAQIVLAAAQRAGAQIWAVGDPRQAKSVAAGGLAQHLQVLADLGDLTAASLETNRRQLDPGDRAALDLLRRGQATASQDLRTAEGWEHQHADAEATRVALAEAAAADIAAHGPEQVAVLCVGHGDAEDLADRIRTHLGLHNADGPRLDGPGWGSDRDYFAGDRVLFHARYGPRTSPLVNGTTATITAIDEAGVHLRLDRTGHPAVVATAWFAGARGDGRPHVSHAWARTVDGAQGGTWQTAHLLGTPALDALRGYTGQSRSRLPTHTWNAAPAPAEPAGPVAEQRTAAEQVAAALARQPETSMAAVDDPAANTRLLRRTKLQANLVEARAAAAASRERVAVARRTLEDAERAYAEAKAARELRSPLHLTRRARARHADASERLAATELAMIEAGERLQSERRASDADCVELHRLEDEVEADRPALTDAARTRLEQRLRTAIDEPALRRRPVERTAEVEAGIDIGP